jgi:polysaccharide chain length determinant protein (PEP-CTERM system associated)
MNEQLSQVYGYLHGMWRYRWSALVIAWIVALVGWPLVFALPDQFSSKAVVYIDTTSVLKPLLKGLAPETDADDELRVMTRILLSRDNLMTVIRETDMDLEVNTAEEREELVEKLAGSIVIDGGGGGKRWEAKTNIYEISYQSRFANRAYKVVSNLLNTMIEGTLSSTRSDAVTAQKFLDTQIVDYERRLSIAEQDLAIFKKENVGFMPDEKGGYYMRLQRAQDSVEKTGSELRLAQRRYYELQKQLKGENPILLGNGGYQSVTDLKISQYRLRLDELLNQFTEQHPDVMSVRSIIKDLKKNGSVSAGATAESIESNPVYQEVKVELSRASVDIETLKIQLAEQTAYVEKLKGSIDVIPEVEAKLSKLNRGYEVTRTRYLDLLERREAAALAKSAGQSSGDITFRVIEPPIVPTKPSGPKRLLLLIGVLLASFAAGLAWSLMRYLWQPTFFEVAQLERVTGFPVLGMVSLHLSPGHKRKRRLQLASFLTANLLLVLVFAAVIWYRQSGVSIMGSLVMGI